MPITEGFVHLFYISLQINVINDQSLWWGKQKYFSSFVFQFVGFPRLIEPEL